MMRHRKFGPSKEGFTAFVALFLDFIVRVVLALRLVFVAAVGADYVAFIHLDFWLFGLCAHMVVVFVLSSEWQRIALFADKIIALSGHAQLHLYSVTVGFLYCSEFPDGAAFELPAAYYPDQPGGLS